VKSIKANLTEVENRIADILDIIIDTQGEQRGKNGQ
jgi:hypothetical protein